MIGCRLGSEDSVSSDQSITFESSFYPSSVFAPIPPSATSLPPPHTSFVSKIHTFHQTPPVFWRASANAVEATVDLSEPSTFQEAVNGPDQVHWRKAIRAELESMRLRGVFRAAKLPNGQRAIGTKWVFKIKRKADGSIEKYKARLVAKGFIEGCWSWVLCTSCTH
ncbi:hypothetical protein Pcac1_g29402 [Phytophthora cactorum]|nr:hypothetical protein Pcac1_g29402 [Phytophthora cactorum]